MEKGVPVMKTRPKKLTVGWRETISLPGLGIHEVAAKIDTGALTTALHATDMEATHQDGRDWVTFLPDHGALDVSHPCRLPLLHRRSITNTSGIPEDRFIVATTMKIGGRLARVEVSLTDRSDMTYPIIIGRSAMRLLRLTVDPSRSWMQSDRNSQNRGKEQA
ncbi:ATP-dependent zinc protease family protein [Antarctobacter jejuensis]|uniref:ATP-dependent zinc protease family protein n=1 Tax=Antarctobacter jejuensis TaxID=1439938 RepID=UPI003FD01D69